MRRLSALFLIAACSGAPGVARHAISGGSDDSGDPAVVAIGERRVECQDTLDLLCSGTLIAPRVVLSAAHCFADLGPDTRYEVFLGGGAVDNSGELHHVVDVTVHPDFDPQTHAADLALLLLDSPSAVAPAALPAAPLDDTFVGKTIRLVGFGATAPGTGAGVKRQGTATITAVDADGVRYQPDPALTCDGDSGGPGFIDEGAGEVLAGVTAAGDAACASFGLDTRVDPFLTSFIQPYLDSPHASPSPSIAVGDLCTAHCAADADCPSGLACGPNQRCVLGGTPAGQFGKVCAGAADCGSCVRVEAVGASACRCFTACPGSGPPLGGPGQGGCSYASTSQPFSLWICLFALVIVQILNGKQSKI